MPHQCVRCNTFYDDGAKEILSGCSCGARLFFIKKDKLEKIKENPSIDLKPEQKKQIEDDVKELIGVQGRDAPVVLDFESIRVAKPGQYELDIVKLFKKDSPIIFKLEEGKYIIDIGESFNRLKGDKGK